MAMMRLAWMMKPQNRFHCKKKLAAMKARVSETPAGRDAADKTKGGGSNINFKIFILQSGHFHNRIKVEKNANYIE